eukprot:CAMPEP_0113949974 /NCGR_PEP_ID=MMETSP1339-20121228/78499_1 /TAXON_ID=94617 /ORGANISM="Fibrocapsa japonica" /LENGTH=197 /DNA_ID=CAMNT_0000957629 /DNA_START=141 /DNA_END=734 /DNA_ORIENTATION=+ /assembly_acc=CAM_ASM_000762
MTDQASHKVKAKVMEGLKMFHRGADPEDPKSPDHEGPKHDKDGGSQNTLSPETYIPESYSNLVQAFIDVLQSGGIRLRLHKGGASSRGKVFKMRLEGINLLLERDNPIKRAIRKEHSIPISDIVGVKIGKETHVLKSRQNKQLSEDVCFSLILREGDPVDIEMENNTERNAVAEGFIMLLNEMQKSSSILMELERKV